TRRTGSAAAGPGARPTPGVHQERDTPMPSDPSPPTDELDRLIRGRLPADRVGPVTDHLGECPRCQDRLDAIAAGNDSELIACVRTCGCDRPPPDSAMWPALSAVEAEVSTTAVFP